MKTFLVSLITLLISFTINAQNITGQWNGVLKVQGIQLQIVFNVDKSDSGYSASMDSPDQGAKGIPVTRTTFKGDTINFVIANAGINYTGQLVENKIVGTFKQGGMQFPLNLTREAIEKEIVNRPQEPAKPYPYYAEEVTFLNANENITLSGTLTLPQKEGIFPVVVLITGSGPQNRDEEIAGHKPFLVISDYLTKNGIGVLRYDDRGVGQSEGFFKTANSADFASDVESAIAYLKTRADINTQKIGLVGHSEGGLIAPMVASKSEDVNFIVLLAGPGMRGDQLLLLQQELIAKASGISESDIKSSLEINAKIFELVLKSEDNLKLHSDLLDLMDEALTNDPSAKIPEGMTKSDFISLQINQVYNPWMQYFLKFDPIPNLQKVKCPVLAINGEKDLQVPPKQNLAAIKNALAKGGNKKVTIIEFPDLNHLFQMCKTGSPMEYASIEQTFSPLVLEEITEWIKAQTK